MPIKAFSTFLSTTTKYNRVPLGFDPSVARFLGHDPTPRPTCPVKVIRCSEWRKILHNKPHIYIINLHEVFARGYDSPWTTWRCFNRLRTGYTCSKTQRTKRKFYIEDSTCSCGKAEESTAHMLQGSQLAHPCSLDDLIMFNDVGKQTTYNTTHCTQTYNWLHNRHKRTTSTRRNTQTTHKGTPPTTRITDNTKITTPHPPTKLQHI